MSHPVVGKSSATGFAGKVQRCWKLYTPQEFSSITSAVSDYTALFFENNTDHSSFSRTNRPLKKEQIF
jgi:hypothetical protein